MHMCMCTVRGNEPTSKQVNSNENLTCTVTDSQGWTNYSVVWYRDGHRLGDSRKYQLLQTASDSVLTVRRVRESDVGKYQCTVTLGTGPARKTLKHEVNLYCTYYLYTSLLLFLKRNKTFEQNCHCN